MNKKILSGIISASLVLSVFTAVPASAEIDMDNLPEPISAEEAKAFGKITPKITLYANGWYREHIRWEPVENALYYSIYKKSPKDKTFKLAKSTVNLDYWDLEVGCEYKIRAVTFTYEDKARFSKYSNTVKSESEYYENEDSCYSSEDVADDYDYSDAGAVADSEYEAEDTVSEAPAEEYVEDEIEQIPNTEEYSHNEESGYKNAATSPLSTFSADVDTASYANIRRIINDNLYVPEDAVRIEEMLNYFDYGYEMPKGKAAFKVNTELSDCPWNEEAQLLKIGIQGKDLEKTPDSNLVFLVDTSGSMGWSDDKFPLVVESIKMLAKTMGENDRISIVTYSGSEDVILAGAKGTQIKTVSALMNILDTEGSTYGEGGIKAAYKIAEKYFIEGGNNRIILATDGDLNVGISDTDELKALIEEKRKSGVYFSVLGYGKDNIKDDKMEVLADNGNGSYHYIDTAEEAAKVLVEERNSTLYTIGKDVKIQLEFNPENVKSYRLIGYDNRRLENEDFTDDTKDAGEVGAGHSVTALYEIIPADGTGDKLKYQQSAGNSDEMLTVKVRYKDTSDNKTYRITKTVKKDSYSETMSDGMKLACAVTQFGLVLKDSDYKGTADLLNALELIESLENPDIYVKQLEALIKKHLHITD
ncbi:MAG: von Willebrand factor type A domain-containing protein [Oscillospiraceae bacterium]|nr:von Willebrand factor type A domain-containing protein [Oscillospiraceae bacterium]